MPPYNMLAGALSKAIGESLGGANEGLLAAEDIRRKREAEALQQQRLGLEQQRAGLEAQMAPIQRQYYQSLIQRHHQPHLFQYGPNVGAVDPRTQQFRALGQFPQSPQQMQESELRQYDINAARRAEEQWPQWQREFRALASDPNVPPSVQRLMGVAATDPTVGKALAVEYIRGVMRQQAGGDIFKTMTPRMREELIWRQGLKDPTTWTPGAVEKARTGIEHEKTEQTSARAAVTGATNRTLQVIGKLSDAERLFDDADRLIERMRGAVERLQKERPDAPRILSLPYVELKRWLGANNDPLLNILTEYETLDAQFPIFARAFDKLTGVRIPVMEAIWARGFHPNAAEPFSAQFTRLAQAERVLRQGRQDIRKQADEAVTRYRTIMEGVGVTPYLAPLGGAIGGAPSADDEQEGFTDR